jgi:hypothetical protein
MSQTKDCSESSDCFFANTATFIEENHRPFGFKLDNGEYKYELNSQEKVNYINLFQNEGLSPSCTLSPSADVGQFHVTLIVVFFHSLNFSQIQTFSS